MTRKSIPKPVADDESTGIDYDILPELLGFHVRRAQITVFNHFGRIIARDGVTPGQFGVLTLINANQGLTQSALAKAVGVERSTMVATIDSLEQRGLVVRQPSPVDRRSYALGLTNDGRSLLTRLKRKVRDHEKRILRGFSDHEKQALLDLLQRIWLQG